LARSPFTLALRELGWEVGKNITIITLGADDQPERLPALARELVTQQVDVILAIAPAAVKAAKEATSTIPIVMAFVGDPVQFGFVASLARPGGNVTGPASLQGNLAAKWVELILECVPTAAQVAFLLNPENPASRVSLGVLRESTSGMSVPIQIAEARRPEEVDNAFMMLAKERPGALIVQPDPLMVSYRARVIEFAARNRLPAIYGLSVFVAEGGLISYVPNTSAQLRIAAQYVDRILKGANPRDLPIEQPTKFELVINLKTARALGLTIPPSLLLRADQVIE
jgi:putative ABC transport system substrate-binding protein